MKLLYEPDHVLYLEHHGVKGQKWGIRRYQNPDGTLTSAGKKRYGTVENFNSEMELKRARRQSIKNVAGGAIGTIGAIGAGIGSVKMGTENSRNTIKLSKKGNELMKTSKEMVNASEQMHERNHKSSIDMSDDELKQVVARMNLEKQYRDLTREDRTRGYENVKNILEISGGALAAGAAVMEIATLIKKFKS